ncbi:nuclease-related domain-containing protein [Amnibacterium flavum]|uniref:NERD domain-containing protein n=1 Tax=Amnibacterium flavum TaxID=2173173 RepID=A0A2V1HRH7_9MICO|nr:nuclease-related domain-containing protein [Amnibacterium flavum]PVZ93570.1 NERD domain-containing protein [Amnibacterium flavum]
MRKQAALDARPTGLLTRPAAYSVIDRCLHHQAALRPRSWFARQIGATPLAVEAKPWFDGARGELEVARLLEGLGEGWTVLHSVPVGKANTDVDHVLIGPAGVFTINTKAVRGHVWVGRSRILVNGRREDFIAKSEREARRVHRLLTAATGSSVFVRPVLVFVEPHRLTVRERPASVATLPARALIRWLHGQEEVYPASRVAELVEAADRPSTWGRAADDGIETRRQIQRFERLLAEVDDAAHRRRTAKLAGVLLALTAALVAVGGYLPVAVAVAMVPFAH